MTVRKPTDTPSVALLPSVELEDARVARLAWLNGRARRFEVTALFGFEGRRGHDEDSVDCLGWFDSGSVPASTRDDALWLVRKLRVTERASWTIADLEGDGLTKLVGAPSTNAIRSLCLVPVRDASGAVRGVVGHFGTSVAAPSSADLADLERAAKGLSPMLLSRRGPCAVPSSSADLATAILDDAVAALLEQSPIAIAVWRGPEHRFEIASAHFLQVFGRKGAVIGRTVREVFHELPVDAPPFLLLDQVYATGAAHSESEFHQSYLVDGALRDAVLAFRLVPTRSSQGVLDGVMVAAVDVTETVRAKEGLERARERAERSERAERQHREHAERERRKSEFLARTAIELTSRLEVESTLARLAELLVPTIVDQTSIWTVDSRDELRRIAVAPRSTVEAAPRTFGANHAALRRDHPLYQVYLAGQSRRFDDFLDWAKRESDPSYAAALERVGMTTALLVPIRTSTRTLGVISVGMATSGRTFDDEAVAMLEAIGRQAGLALENARLFEDSARLRELAEQASVAKDQFLARVSHDLRNPLASILGWSSVLLADPGDPLQVARGLEVIDRNAKAQARLVEDLLDLSRIVVGKLRIELAPVMVPAAVEAALEATRFAAQAKDIRVSVDVEPDVGVVAADPDRLQQVMWNLLSNAVKYTPAGGHVSVRVRRESNRVVLTVSDDGRGLEPELLPHVFETFHQARDGGRSGGLGLGLAIVRHIVELHGGTVHVASAGLGKGSCFTVVLPIRAALRAIESDADQKGRHASPRLLDGLHVLVVDDEEDAVALLAAVLQEAGATVDSARSGLQALEAIDRRRPDAVVSDLEMPELDGYGLIRELRAREATSTLPVVALTAYALPQDRARALTAGFTAHAAKPVEPTELAFVLASSVGRSLLP